MVAQVAERVEAVRKPSPAELDELNRRLEGDTPQGIIRWALEEWGDGLVLACSFGGISGMALLDMAVEIEPELPIFYLDTDFLFPETLATRDRAIAKYGIRPEPFRARLTPEQQAREHGPELWRRDPDRCCGIRKVEPNRRALEGRSAWIAGLRRDQASTRREIRIVSWDQKFGMYKLAPLAAWDERRVWRYIFERGVPYNPLHDRGFPSIGCTHCTQPVFAGEEGRAGRWSGTGKVECGLHK